MHQPAVRGRNRVTEVPPKAFNNIIDAYVEQQTCGRRRKIYRLEDLFCVASSAVQAKEAWAAAKEISLTPLTYGQIQKQMAAEKDRRMAESAGPRASENLPS